jgi:membrane protease YdiL (CAAX protease family)
LESIPFSTYQELNRILGYNIPSILLIWYIIYLKGKEGFRIPKPGFEDLVSLLLALPGLLALGFGLSLIASFFTHILPVSPQVEPPRGALQWWIMAASCLSTGYLEETYFRYYLLSRPLPGGGNGGGRMVRLAGLVVFSTLLFSLCHFYEGILGAVNALLAGLLLSLVFIRYKSLHGIAWAHGLYNIFIYTAGMAAKA